MVRQSLLDKIELLLSLKVEYLDYEDLSVTFSANRGASIEELGTMLRKTNLVFPDVYLDFLKKINGCELFKFKELGGFEFLGTNEIQKENSFQQESYMEDWDKRLTVFCNLICDGDFLSFKSYDNGTYEIIDCYHDDLPKNWNVISNSFEDFLERLIDLKGKRYW